jgi:hypothetical protein
MQWQTKVYLFTQWIFILSIVWFTIGLIIVSSTNWWILISVPFAGLVAIGYWIDYKDNKLKNKG